MTVDKGLTKSMVFFLTFDQHITITELEIVLKIYRELITRIGKAGIPVNMRIKSLVGTVQDDPFDNWIELEIKKALPKTFEIFHSGSLTTPDLIVRDKISGTIVVLEIKKLIQKANGGDKGYDNRLQ